MPAKRGENETMSKPYVRAADTTPATRPGFGSVSASMPNNHSPDATARPRSSAQTLPIHPSGSGRSSITRNRGSTAAIASTCARVSSVEPLSMTMTSVSGGPCCRSPARHGPMRRPSLSVGSRTLTVVSVTPSRMGRTGGARRRPPCKRPRSIASATACSTTRRPRSSVIPSAAPGARSRGIAVVPNERLAALSGTQRFLDSLRSLGMTAGRPGGLTPNANYRVVDAVCRFSSFSQYANH